MSDQQPEFLNFQSSVRSVDIHVSSTNPSKLPSTSSVANLSKSSSGTHFKSAMKLEDKFRRYVSEADMLFRSLSKGSANDSEFEALCDSAHLLIKNTESFRCLAQLMLSNSSLMKNRLFLFPPLEDPGINAAFNFEEPPPENDDVGVEKYRKICKELGIVPISRIINSLETSDLDLKYYGLTSNQIKALTEALKANARVQTLTLQDNWLNLEMTQMVSDMVVENTSLNHLSLKECRIGEDGAQKLGEVLSSLQTLKSLDLSFNDLGDIGLLALRDGLSNNISLKTLNVSHNNLTEDCADAMATILMENKCLEDLDLSWNGFNTVEGNKKLFYGFLHSDRIKILNLAWNGLGIPQAVRPLTRYMTKATNLEVLDLSSNRIAGKPLRAIRTAINKNHSLQVVKMGNNIYSTEDAHFLLTVLAGKPKDPLHHLDMENMYIKKESKVVLKKIKALERTVNIGGILSDYEIRGPNPRKLIYERCRYILNKPKKAKARKDFGHFILQLPESPITPENFKKELKRQKIKKLDTDLVQGLMNSFINKKKLIECSDLVKDYMSFYPETQLPPAKPKKAKAGKKRAKGKYKDTEEKLIQVHDLEISPEPQNANTVQSRSSLTRTSKKSIQRPTGSTSNLGTKSVSILPEASVILERDMPYKDAPEIDAAPKKSIIKIRESKEEFHRKDSSKADIGRKSSLKSEKRSSEKAIGSKASIPAE